MQTICASRQWIEVTSILRNDKQHIGMIACIWQRSLAGTSATYITIDQQTLSHYGFLIFRVKMEASQLITPPQEPTCTVVDIEVKFDIEVHGVQTCVKLGPRNIEIPQSLYSVRISMSEWQR